MRPPHPLEVVETARRNNDLTARANAAAHIATLLWPGVAGEVLAAECRAAAEFPWIADERGRTVRLIEELLAMEPREVAS